MAAGGCNSGGATSVIRHLPDVVVPEGTLIGSLPSSLDLMHPDLADAVVQLLSG